MFEQLNKNSTDRATRQYPGHNLENKMTHIEAQNSLKSMRANSPKGGRWMSWIIDESTKPMPTMPWDRSLDKTWARRLPVAATGLQ